MTTDIKNTDNEAKNEAINKRTQTKSHEENKFE